MRMKQTYGKVMPKTPVVKRWTEGRKDLDPWKETGAKVKPTENQGATPEIKAQVKKPAAPPSGQATPSGMTVKVRPKGSQAAPTSKTVKTKPRGKTTTVNTKPKIGMVKPATPAESAAHKIKMTEALKRANARAVLEGYKGGPGVHPFEVKSRFEGMPEGKSGKPTLKGTIKAIRKGIRKAR